MGFLLIIATVVIVAVPPTVHEFHVLVNNLPRYKLSLNAGRSWAGQWVHKLYLTAT